jgi:hypothetical protein
MKNKQWIVLIVTLISIFGLYWINAGMTPLKKTGEVAGREEIINYTLPPGFIFSIWGVIYLGFLVFAVYGLTRKGSEDPYIKDTATLVAVSIFLNLVWTAIVGAEWWGWAYPLQWLMLVLALVILFRWQTYRPPLSKTQQWLSIPFALYAGWLTVAMIPFTSDLLNRSGWEGEPFTRVTWAVILYVTACIIVLVAFLRLRQPFYLLPLAWALFGFSVRFEGVLQRTAAGLAAVLILIFLVQVVKFFRAGRTSAVERNA